MIGDIAVTVIAGILAGISFTLGFLLLGSAGERTALS
jgi:hypothetical protein